MNLRQLFPQYTDEQVKEAEENLQRYLELVVRTYNRIRQDPQLYKQFQDALTASRARATRFKGQAVPPHAPT